MRLSLALTAVCCLTVGVLIGLGVAALRPGRIAELEQVNDQLTAKNGKLQEDLDELRRVGRKAASDLDELARKLEAADSDVAAQLEKVQQERAKSDRLAAEALAGQMKSLVVIGLMRDSDAFVSLIRDPKFRRSYKRDWFFPDTATQLLGGRWFLEDLVRCGVVSRDLLDNIDRRQREEAAVHAKWRVVKTWTIQGRKDTESFRTTSDFWRVAWQGPGYVSIGVYRAGSEEIVASCSGEKPDRSFVRAGAGAYYLSVGSTARVEVSVEEPVE